ncbi:hypothetical protein [Nocardia tengchongensis]|uniref:hypothetical protein n=1 Tax=Nocardia tengchongensis TaxID=2055889 RepID=UPI00365C39D2
MNSTAPTMTAAQLRDMITEWQDAATRDNEEIGAAIESLTGLAQNFGPGRPVPVCPTCGWESTERDQSDFQITGPDTDTPRIAFGCGHGWTITEIPGR